MPTHLIAAAIAVIAVAAPAATQGQDPRRLVTPDSVPFDLAAALIGAGGFSGAPQILVGSMPEWVANRLYVPSGARVLGSAFLGTTVVGVVSIPAASDSVLAELKRELMQRGWTSPPPPPIYAGGGFRSAPAPVVDGPFARLILCGDEQTLTASAARRAGIVTDITFRVTAGGTYVCHPSQGQATASRSSLPTLFNPVAADARMAGNCFSPFQGSMGTSATLRTSMTSEALLDHYGRQLEDSGWTTAGEKASIVGRSWTRPDSAGGSAEATITVATPARDSGCRELNLQVRTQRRP